VTGAGLVNAAPDNMQSYTAMGTEQSGRGAQLTAQYVRMGVCTWRYADGGTWRVVGMGRIMGNTVQTALYVLQGTKLPVAKSPLATKYFSSAIGIWPLL
jgi:hypothetical protein